MAVTKQDISFFAIIPSIVLSIAVIWGVIVWLSEKDATKRKEKLTLIKKANGGLINAISFPFSSIGLSLISITILVVLLVLFMKADDVVKNQFLKFRFI